jgi:hypothetical protein
MNIPNIPPDIGASRFKGNSKFQKRLFIIPIRKSIKNKPKRELRNPIIFAYVLLLIEETRTFAIIRNMISMIKLVIECSIIFNKDFPLLII